MLMGYLNITCPECQRKLRHHMRDLEIRKNRICPDCGTLIKLEEYVDPSEGDLLT